MKVLVGKTVRVEGDRYFEFECTPHYYTGIKVVDRGYAAINADVAFFLPATPESARRFCDAYLAAVDASQDVRFIEQKKL